MRTLIAALAIALSTISAAAQSDPLHSNSPNRNESYARDSQKDAQRASANRKKSATHKAYQDALKRIPDSDEKRDPWSTLR